MNTDSSRQIDHGSAPVLSDYPHIREERLRMTDLDFQKHVNNAAQTALLANARFDFLHDVVRPHLPAHSKLVIASLNVDFIKEMHYGDPVFIGTRMVSIGRSSVRLEQAMFQADVCAARSGSVFVHIDGEHNRSAPWPDAVRALVQTQPTRSS